MKYCIDYRNGGMGNTVLAHMLFCCHQIDIDVDQFFSNTGNAHAIYRFNNPQIVARHLIEFPDSDMQCVIRLVCSGWSEIMRWKMSYNKSYGVEPGIDNWHIFFKQVVDHDLQPSWNEFYSVIKDPSWPQCPSLEDSLNLPERIQKEIRVHWSESAYAIKTENQLLEFLTQCYHDQLKSPMLLHVDAPIYYLDQYLDNDLEILIATADRLGWKWDPDRSFKFHAKVLDSNNRYMSWIDAMKSKYHNTLEHRCVDLDWSTWESAALIAKICYDARVDPKSLHWTESTCINKNKSINLYEFIGI